MVLVGKGRLTTEDFEKLLYLDEPVTLDTDAVARVTKNFEFLKKNFFEKFLVIISVMVMVNFGYG